MSVFRCPECDGKIKDKNYDEDFEMYECPGCEGLFTFAELVEHGAENAAGKAQEGTRAAEKAKVPLAKGKLRRQEREADEELADKQIEEITKDKHETKKEERHRDEIKTGLVLNVIADEIEAICEEVGISMSRLNAREFYAMNLYRPLLVAGVRAREQDVEHRLCKEHS